MSVSAWGRCPLFGSAGAGDGEERGGGHGQGHGGVMDQPPPASSLDARPKGKAKYLRVVVDAGEDGEQTRVNVRCHSSCYGHRLHLAVLALCGRAGPDTTHSL